MMHMSWKNALLRSYVHAILKKEAGERNLSISDFIEKLLIEQGYEIKKPEEAEATV